MADFSSIRKEECRAKPMPPGCHLGPSKTIVLQSVLNDIKAHGRSSMHAEVCGVLVGALCWDNGPYLLIDGRIEGKHATQQSGSVTFTAETWNSIHEELAAKHPDRIIVGWYHTHPGFGIFLSNMDAFIHENFFSFPWQPAYVFDPQAETDGFFFRSGTNLEREEVCIAPDAKPVVKKPMIGDVGEGITIPDEPGRKSLLIGGILAAALLLLLSAIAISTFLLLQQSKQKTRLVETRAKTLEQTIRQQEDEHRKSKDAWRLKRHTYKREIDGLHVTVTQITAERQNIEKENAEHKEAIARLETKQTHQAETIRCLESELQTSRDAERKKSDELEDARKRVQQLQADLEAAKAVAATLGREEEEPGQGTGTAGADCCREIGGQQKEECP